MELRGSATRVGGSGEFRISAGEVHVWSVPLHASSTQRMLLYRILDDPERKRLRRFAFERDRRRFALSHGFLRTMLAAYLNVSPRAVSLVYSATGKPTLHPELLDSQLQFNLSHSGDVAVIAITLADAVGVDIEEIRPIADFEMIARQFFSSVEVNDLFALAPDLRLAGFFRCWTRKEAYVKAIGDGLSAPLDQFQVVVRPDQPAQLVSVHGDRGRAAEWTMLDLRLPDGYSGTCLVHRVGASLQLRNLASLYECLDATRLGRSRSLLQPCKALKLIG